LKVLGVGLHNDLLGQHVPYSDQTQYGAFHPVSAGASAQVAQLPAVLVIGTSGSEASANFIFQYEVLIELGGTIVNNAAVYNA